MDSGTVTAGDSQRPAGPATARGRTVVRSTLAALAGVVATLALIASVVAIWARGAVFDESHVSGAVEQALEQPAVTDAFARYVTDLVLDAEDLTAAVAEILPDQLDRLAPAVVGGVRNLVHDELTDLLARDGTRQVVVSLVERAHRALMRLLDGDGVISGLTVDDGEVSINLLPLVALGLRALQSQGFLQGVTIPELTADGDPAAQAAELEAALDRDLREGFGQLVVYRSDSLAAAGTTLSGAQRAIAVLKRATTILVLLTIAAFPATVLLARRRRRAVVVLAVAAGLGLLLTRALVNTVLRKAPDATTDPGASAAIAAILESLSRGLVAGTGLLALLCLLLAVAVYLDGPSPTADALRARLTGTGTAPASRADERRVVAAVTALIAAALCIAIADLGAGLVVAVVALVAVATWCWWPVHRTRRQPTG